jgi:hypothetical protein
MRGIGRYDTALQMFVQETKEPDIRKLTFLRWLVENNRLEHSVYGPQSGEYAAATTPENPEIPLASFRRRDRGFNADLGGRYRDGVSLGNISGESSPRFFKERG